MHTIKGIRNMKISLRYKIFATVVLLFIAFVSLNFGFNVAPSRTIGNEVYWVFKAWSLTYLAVLIGGFWLKSKRFSRLGPAGLMVTCAQLIPELSRIGFKGENPSVHVSIIVISSVLFATVLFASIYLYFRPIRIENTKN